MYTRKDNQCCFIDIQNHITHLFYAEFMSTSNDGVIISRKSNKVMTYAQISVNSCYWKEHRYLTDKAPSLVKAMVSHHWLVAFFDHGPLARYVNLRVAHAQGMTGTFSPSPGVTDPDMHHGTFVTHVPWRMSGSLILWIDGIDVFAQCIMFPLISNIKYMYLYIY